MIHVDALISEQGDFTVAISAPAIRISNSRLIHKNWISFPNAKKNLTHTGENLGITEAYELAHDLFNSDKRLCLF